MSFTIKYLPLFKVEFHHYYFLNNGLIDFNSMDPAEQERRLRLHNFNTFFKITPANYTHKVLSGHHLLAKPSDNGFAVWCKVDENVENAPFIHLNDDLSLTFLIQLSDFSFFNYTDLNLDKSSSLKYFSNKILEGEPEDFPLIQKSSGTNTPIGDEYNLSADNETKELLKLTNSEKNRLFGLIRIYMQGDISNLNVTLVNGNIRKIATVFNLTFENRKTVWRYIFTKDQQNIGSDFTLENNNPKVLITKDPRPLTENGYVSLTTDGKELPNPDAKMIVPGDTINKYFSEIYM